MQKIPTMFVRDPDDRAHVTDQITPGCEWVTAGEGTATRKYDGTCVMYDGQAWWARREVKPGKKTPPNYLELHTDDVTGRTVGWEPIAQSPFDRFHFQAIEERIFEDPGSEHNPQAWPVGTYELIGPKINGNPERWTNHDLVAHATAEEYLVPDRGFVALRAVLVLLHDLQGCEGLVFHHPDGRMAKIKKRDFSA